MMKLSYLAKCNRDNQIRKLLRDFRDIAGDTMFHQRAIREINSVQVNQEKLHLEHFCGNYFFRSNWDVAPRYSQDEAKTYFRRFLQGENAFAGDVYQIALTAKIENARLTGTLVNKELNEIIRETSVIAAAVSAGHKRARVSEKRKYEKFERLFLSGAFECMSYAANVTILDPHTDIEEVLEHIELEAGNNYVATLLLKRDYFKHNYIHMALITPLKELPGLKTGFHDQSCKKAHLELVWDRDTMGS